MSIKVSVFGRVQTLVFSPAVQPVKSLLGLFCLFGFEVLESEHWASHMLSNAFSTELHPCLVNFIFLEQNYVECTDFTVL
jgi:hypothetical protein